MKEQLRRKVTAARPELQTGAGFRKKMPAQMFNGRVPNLVLVVEGSVDKQRAVF